jgi:hypothetical protein
LVRVDDYLKIMEENLVKYWVLTITGIDPRRCSEGFIKFPEYGTKKSLS